jgi:DNA polymerase bacteriophage-type
MMFIDFETKSACDLKKHGVYNYAQDRSTEVLCMSYAFDGDVQTWTPDQPFPDAVRNYKGEIRAHNATFERLIFWYVLGINFKLEQFNCTATQARANCLPGSLEDIGRAMSAKMKKDHRGKQLIRQCCVPPYNIALLPELIHYCEQDVRAMREVSLALRQLDADELLDYHVNERINDRGLLIDVPLCHAAIGYATAELEDIQTLVKDITGIASARSPKLKQWVADRVDPELMMVEDKLSLNKATRTALLQLDLPDEVLDVVQCIDDISASSVAKFKRMGELADVEDHRVRGAFVFNGGSATGRASSYGVQLQNMARVCAKDPVAVRSAMMAGDDLGAFGSRVTDVLKGMIRPAIIPAPGNVLIVADWAGIEARCNPWLAKQPSSEAKLDIFRSGGDVYVENAKSTFNTKEVTKEQRFIGKVQELALGYSGGAGAFASMARIYGLNMPEHQIKRMINGWRVANPWCIPYGQELERAYMSAIRHKGYEFSAGRVTYLFDGNHLWYILPSGRILNYPFARIEDGAVTYLKAAFKPASDAVEWPRARLWQGIAQENCAQATANDLLRYSLRQLDGVIAHIHDEIVVECREDEAENITKRMTSCMCSAPVWAEGLPLDVEIATMYRYGK